MPVTSNWTDPSAGGSLDLAAGQIVTETNLDAIVSDLLFLGGSAGIVTQAVSQTSVSSESTTSGTAVELIAPQVAITTGATAAAVLLIGTFCVANSLAGSADNYFYFGVNHVAQGPYGRFKSTAANVLQQVTIQARWFLTASATSTLSLFWSTSAGTLLTDTSCVRGITVIELRR